MWPLFNSCLEPEMTNVMVSYSIKMRALELCSMGGQWVWSTRLSLMWPLFDSGLEPEMTNVMVSYCITDGSIRFKLHVWSVGMKRHLSLSWPWFDSRLRLYSMLVEFWVGSLQCYECFFLWAFHTRTCNMHWTSLVGVKDQGPISWLCLLPISALTITITRLSASAEFLR